MKKILVILALVATTCVVSYAQTADKASVKAKAFVDKMNSTLVLKGDQFSKVNAIVTDFFNKKAAIQADTNLGSKEADEKLAQAQTERDTKLKGVLTPDQWKTYEKETAGQK